MTDPIEFARAGVLEPRGLMPGDDPAFLAVGVLVSIDTDSNRVVVAVNGSSGTRMPFIDGVYTIGKTVYVMRNPFDGGRSVMCLGPTRSAPMRVVGKITAVDASNNRATVTVVGSSFVLPYIPLTTFAVDDEVFVLREPQFGGQPTLILGPCTVPQAPPAPEPPPPAPEPDPEDDEPTPPPPPPPPPEFETVSTTILPSYSGTYRVDRGAWDRWNTGRYGGRSTLYQGTSTPWSSEGPFKGLACYGNQVRNLGATSIGSIQVRLRGAALSLASYPSITVQGSPHGSRPGGSPSSSGDTATGSPGKSGAVWVSLPASVRSAFLSGSVKGLVLTGSGYNAVRGTSAADGMALKITYTRPA